MIFQLKKFTIWSMESLCGVKDRTWLTYIPNKWTAGCKLASLSAELDERWNTGVWYGPDDPRCGHTEVHNE